MKKWIAIAAMDQDRGVGLNGTIPWYLPDDLRFFRQKTMGGTVIMGRKTWESLPSVLRGRRNIVLSSTMKPCDGIEIARDHDELMGLLKRDNPEHPGDLFVIGGERVWARYGPTCDELFLTVLKQKVYADTFFPHLESYFSRSEIIRETDEAMWFRFWNQ